MKRTSIISRTLCLALAAVSLALMASCVKDNGGNTTTTTAPVSGDVTTGVAETTAAYEALPVADFDKYEFRILTRPTTWSYDTMALEETSGNLLDDIVYNRQRLVSERLNIVMTEINSQNISKEISTAVSTQTHLYDICQLPTGTALQSYLRGEVLDIASIDTIDLENPWWASSINNSVNIGSKRYVVFGQGHLNYYCGFYILAFNKGLVTDNGLESPYDCVDAGTWTHEKMYTMMKTAARDYNNDGFYDVSEDVLGFTGHVNHMRNLMISSGETITHNDADGYPVYDGLSERYIDVFTDFMNKFMSEPCAAVAGSPSNRYEGFSSGASSLNYAAVFNEGRALFESTGTYEVQTVRDLDFEYGLVIVPKYNADQEDYVAPVYSYVEGMTIPSTAPDPEDIGLILETIYAATDGKLVTNLVGNILHYKCSNNPTDIKMINMVFEKGQLDIALANNFGNCINLLHTLHTSQSTSIKASFDVYKKKFISDINAAISGMKS